MTIQVNIAHGQAGHPAPIYVTPVDPVTLKPNGPAVTLPDGHKLAAYVHQHKALLVTERPVES